MKRAQSDLYVFKMLPPEMLIKVRNFALKLIMEDLKKKAIKEATDDQKRS
jgi:hypothetical protein